MTDYSSNTYLYDGRVPVGTTAPAAPPFDHGALSGLHDNDHPQYLSTATLSYTVTTADNTGVTDATAQLQADLATAIASSTRRLYIPAGTYKVSATAGTILNLSADGCEVFGDGIGKTIIQLAPNIAITSNLYMFVLNARHQTLRDLSIYWGSGMSGAFEYGSVLANNTSFYARVQRVEVVGGYGTTSTGFGIGTYQPWNQLEINTTLGTTIPSGVQSVTPGSMLGIYPGRRLSVGGTAETVVVSSRTETTFTATFANAHNAADSLTAVSGGRQFTLFEDCVVRDGWQTTAIGVNSSCNVVRRCTVSATGATTLWHGIYEQGGYNTIEENYIEGVRGYAIHGHKSVPNIDASGCRYVNNTTINPGAAHILLDLVLTNLANTDYPIGADTNRYGIIQGNVCRNMNGWQSDGIRVSLPVTISGNTLEDIFPTAGGGWIDDSSTYGAVIQGNVCRTTQTPQGAANHSMIRANGSLGTVIQGNRLMMTVTGGTGIKASGTVHRIIGNYVLNTTSQGPLLDLAGTNVLFAENYAEATSTAVVLVLGTLTSLQFVRNVLKKTGDLCNVNLANVAGVIADNVFDTGLLRYSATNQALVLANNSGRHSFASLAASVLDSAAGTLTAITGDGSGASEGRLLKMTATGAAMLGTSDTVCIGASVTATPSGYHALQVGAVVPIDCDGAWTAGHVGIPSTTSAGKVHDSGVVTAPASGSYVLFLDSGGGAGSARCMLVKTL